MNYEKAMEWANALDSGEYLQGFGFLSTLHPHKKTAHCCLGVECQLALKNDVPLEISKRVNSTVLSYDNGAALLPKQVVDWGEFRSLDPYFVFERNDGYLDSVTLTELNDDGFTFSQIADLIRRFWDQL